MVIPQKLVKERVKDHLFASKSDCRKERTVHDNKSEKSEWEEEDLSISGW